MGTVEDVRKMFQDFLAPELHAIDQKLKNVEQGHAEASAASRNHSARPSALTPSDTD